MGTNYYLHRNECPHCHRTDEPLHIGKSSFGWCFSLHVEPEPPTEVASLDDWRRLWSEPGAFIKNEYGEVVPTAIMEDIITKRGWEPGTEPKRPDFDWSRNDAEQGPRGLLRARVGSHCVGHGEGTWDLIPGDFS